MLAPGAAIAEQALEGTSRASHEAMRLVSEGRLLIRVGQVEEGRSAFERARSVAPLASISLEEGKVLEEIGRLREAHSVYRSYLAMIGELHRTSDEVRGRIAMLERELERDHGLLEVIAHPSSAEVYLNRVAPANRIESGQARFVPSGRHLILARADGFVDREEEVSIGAGDFVETVTVELSPQLEPGTLQVRANQRHAEVYLDGERRCTVPCEIDLLPDIYLVSVVHPEAQPLKQLVKVLPGDTFELGAMLRLTSRALASDTAPRREPPPEPPGVREVAQETMEVDDGLESEEDKAKRTAWVEPVVIDDELAPAGWSALGITGWAMLGAGIGAAGTGGVFHYLAISKADEANQLPVGEEFDDRFDSLKRESDRNTIIMASLYATGGALVVSGVTMIIVDALRRPDPATRESGRSGPSMARLSATPLPGGGLVAGSWRFP